MLAGRYLQSQCFDSTESMIVDDTEKVKRYYEGVYLGMVEEQIRAMVLNDKLRMVREHVILEGSIEKIPLTARRVADFVIRNGCNRVILSHNHPKGLSNPSRSDLAITKSLVNLLKEFEIDMMDHIVVGRAGSTSIRSTIHGPGIWSELLNDDEQKNKKGVTYKTHREMTEWS